MTPEEIQDKLRNFPNSPDAYVFPANSWGIDVVSSKQDMMDKVRRKFNEQLYEHLYIQLDYFFLKPTSNAFFRSEYEYESLVCRRCNNRLVYYKHPYFDNQYYLKKLSRIHIHCSSDHPMFHKAQALKTALQQVQTRYGVLPYYFKRRTIPRLNISLKNLYGNMPEQPYVPKVRCAEESGFERGEAMKVLHDGHIVKQVPIKETFATFQSEGTKYFYLPSDLLEFNRQIKLYSDKDKYEAILRRNSTVQHEHQKISFANPELPTVLLVITPLMKQTYKLFGKTLGFDLTFSLIRERQMFKDYKVGTFTGGSESRRTCVFAIVFTFTQTVEFYNFIFTEFLRQMKQQPQSIVTDQEKAIYYSLRDLKNQGVFTGEHLLDVFHILKKFRKNGLGCHNFQLMRKLIHAKDRFTYRRALKQMLESVKNDAQLQLVRLFDYYSQKYCYSQVATVFVGMGVSDSTCEQLNGLIKSQVPEQVKYIKGLRIVLDIAEHRNKRAMTAFCEKLPIQDMTLLPSLKQLRLKVSAQNLKELSATVAKSIRHKFYRQGLNWWVHTKIGLFCVYTCDKASPYQPTTWNCTCEYRVKSGLFCSHIAAIVIHLGDKLEDQIDPKWITTPERLSYRFLSKETRSQSQTLNMRQATFRLALPKGVRVKPKYDEKIKANSVKKKIIQQQKQPFQQGYFFGSISQQQRGREERLLNLPQEVHKKSLAAKQKVPQYQGKNEQRTLYSKYWDEDDE